MERLSIAISEYADMAKLIATVRKHRPCSVQLIQNRLLSKQPIAVFNYSGNDINEAVIHTKALLKALSAINVEFRLFESNDVNELGEETTLERVMNEFQLWDDIYHDIKRHDRIR